MQTIRHNQYRHISTVIETEGSSFHEGEQEMRRSGKRDTLVICVSPGLNGKWDVSEKGQEAPIASFTDMEEAYAFAAELTKASDSAAVLLEEDEGFEPLYVREHGKVSELIVRHY